MLGRITIQQIVFEHYVLGSVLSFLGIQTEIPPSWSLHSNRVVRYRQQIINIISKLYIKLEGDKCYWGKK